MRSPISWLVIPLLAACNKSPTPSAGSATPIASAASSAAPLTSAPPVASASVDAAAGDAAADDSYANHTAAGLVSECVERTGFGYLCNNAYDVAKQRFPKDAAVIQSLMKLAVRVDAGKPHAGEAEVASFCKVEEGEGDAYSCLMVADRNPTPRGKKAHELACKGAPPEGQLPIAGGTAVCDGDRPIRIKPLPKGEADEVRRCFACGNSEKFSRRELTKLASAKACVALKKRLTPEEAAFVESAIQPLCPSGS